MKKLFLLVALLVTSQLSANELILMPGGGYGNALFTDGSIFFGFEAGDLINVELTNHSREPLTCEYSVDCNESGFSVKGPFILYPEGSYYVPHTAGVPYSRNYWQVNASTLSFGSIGVYFEAAVNWPSYYVWDSDF